ncbi:MAG: aminotransferase class V-fold PLP-dependent enzyme [Bacteroidota bacterium]
MPTTRRAFLSRTAFPALATVTIGPSPGRLLDALATATGTPASALARDEEFWREIQAAFTVDRSLVNLNNGGVSPSPAYVQEAVVAHQAFSNKAPTYTMWRVLEPQREGVRQRLARAFGCDAEEIAFTRNASEGLQILQNGFDLQRGDEMLTSTHDYPRMINTFKQRERREGIVLKQFDLPVPAENVDALVQLYLDHVTPRTRLALVPHVVNLTGQILPVKPVVEALRQRDIPVIVDGAHSFAHFPFSQADLGCDYYATSLHKWLFAPHGTGMLYVRREKIPDVWPLTAATERQDDDIRKFEEIGTHPAAPALAVAEALTFHEGIGAERKAERLRYLMNYWVERVQDLPGVTLYTSLDPRFSCGIATVGIDGQEPGPIGTHLFARHRIIVTPIVAPNVSGLRVSPSVYTTLEELDRFADAFGRVAREGLPQG